MKKISQSIMLSKKIGGKIAINSKVPLNNESLPIVYTPGVADVCLAIAKQPKLANDYTFKNNSVAVISDGSAVLGLGNIGPLAGLPVMEGKCLLFNEMVGINAVPIVLDTQDTEEIIQTIKNIAPTFGGINLEDISAPRCFEIEERLKAELDIPVFHDDQHGTAVVVLAGLINAAIVTKRNLKKSRVVIAGSGAAGVAVAKLLHSFGVKEIRIVDSKGVIAASRKDLSPIKKELAGFTNARNITGTLADAVVGADIFIGVSAPNILSAEDVATMNENPIVFALGNPSPEIHPDDAAIGGAAVIATGRSDFPNQINNVLVFPGLFRGAFLKKKKAITETHKLKAAKAIAGMIQKPTAKKIIPKALDKKVVKVLADIF